MPSSFQPGDLVRHWASLNKWPVAERTILVEGEHDQRYFRLADRLYHEKTGLRLLGKGVAIFPTGLGDQGGSFGLQKHFPTLRAIMDRDSDANGKKGFHAIALFDDDQAGRRGFAALTGQHLMYKKWRDVFLLKRQLARTTRDTLQLEKLVSEQNQLWRNMDCEIEDLISIDLIKEFLSQDSGALQGPIKENGDAIHCSFHGPSKAKIIRFVEEYAVFEDVEKITDVLKSLRYHLGLHPDGEQENR